VHLLSQDNLRKGGEWHSDIW